MLSFFYIWIQILYDIYTPTSRMINYLYPLDDCFCLKLKQLWVHLYSRYFIRRCYTRKEESQFSLSIFQYFHWKFPPIKTFLFKELYSANLCRPSAQILSNFLFFAIPLLKIKHCLLSFNLRSQFFFCRQV